MVIEFGVGCPEVAVAGLTNFKAEVYIVEGDAEFFFIEAAYFLKDALAYEEARGSDGGKVLYEQKTIEIAWMGGWKIFVAMTSDPSQSEYHAAVLEGAIGIIQFRSYAADLWTDGMRNHFCEPFR